MRFLLGLSLGLLMPMLFRAWLKCPASKTIHKIQVVGEKKPGNGALHEAISPTSPDRAQDMRSENRHTEFDWPAMQGSSQDSDFQW